MSYYIAERKTWRNQEHAKDQRELWLCNSPLQTDRWHWPFIFLNLRFWESLYCSLVSHTKAQAEVNFGVPVNPTWETSETFSGYRTDTLSPQPSYQLKLSSFLLHQLYKPSTSDRQKRAGKGGCCQHHKQQCVQGPSLCTYLAHLFSLWNRRVIRIS